jgi:hypothetical protein
LIAWQRMPFSEREHSKSGVAQKTHFQLTPEIDTDRTRARSRVGLVATSMPKLPIWKAYCFNSMRFINLNNILKQLNT